jgi:hypothetical protein
MTMTRHFTLCILVLLIAGCGSGFEGIKLRMQSPPIEEAFRKMTLAITTDGYEVGLITPGKHTLVTQWRVAKSQEIPASGLAAEVQRTECRLTVRMEERGKLFDVMLTPSLRYTMHDGTAREESAAPKHPLTEKWQKVMTQLMEKEQKEED